MGTSLYPTKRIGGVTYLKHRLAMEKKLGRKLRTDEIVHHRDEDRQNFKLRNLQLTTRLGHGAMHRGPKKPINQDRVLQLYANGTSIKAIAKRLGVGRDRVYVVLRAHRVINPWFMNNDTVRKRKL